ncbi:MAG: hypothetical protein L3J98_15980 [Gammaproteobacteria bacterium]|nr:hypothetical protein [Gammaproteobacteria bacterium]MCF6261635.1 hypothetical protein [Gammaproteobacteria bacterium]
MSLKKRHSALLAVHLEEPNLLPRALIGIFSGLTVVKMKRQHTLYHVP